MRTLLILPIAVLLMATANAGPRDDLVAEFATQAKSADPGFAGFSAARGKTFSLKDFAQGKPDTPACTTCHTASPAKEGRTRAGKPIQPMAVSRTPNRYTDRKKVAKWFRRNCRSVLGRLCTAREKGDYLTFMIGQ